MTMNRLVAMVIALLMNTAFGSARFKAVEGKLDLSHWDMEKDPVIKIDGDVAFYWQQFLKTDPPLAEKPVYLKLPARWNIESSFPEHGYGTYRLWVKNAPNEPIGMVITPSWSSLRFYADDKQLFAQGLPGSNKSRSLSYVKGSLKAVVHPHTDTIELTGEVSNFEFFQAGGFEILLGKPSEVFKTYQQRLLTRSLMVGATFIIGIYHFILFALRRKDFTTFFFALFCIFESLSQSVWGAEKFLLDFRDLSFRESWNLYNVAWIGIVVAFGAYEYSFFPRQFSKRIVWIFSTTLVVIAIGQFFLDDVGLKYVTYLLQVLSLGYINYGVWVEIKALRAREEDSKIFFLFNIALTGAGIYEIVQISVNQSAETQISLYGIMIFILGQSFILSRRFSKAFHTAEHLSANLKAEVEIQTETLTAQKRKLEEQADIISEILDNAQIGLILIDESRRTLPNGFSAKALELLGAGLSTRPIEEVIFPNSKDQANFRGLFEQIFELPFLAEEMANQLPTSFLIGKKYISLEFSVIKVQDSVKSVLISLKDETELLKSREEISKAFELFNLLKQKDRFKVFIQSFEDSMSRMDSILNAETDFVLSEAGRREIKIILHTLKGNILSFKISKVFPLDAICHELEEKSDFNRKDYDLIQTTFESFLVENERTLSIILGEKSQGSATFSGNVIKRFIALLDKLTDSGGETFKLKRELIAASGGFNFEAFLQGWSSETERLAKKFDKNVKFEANIPPNVLNGDLFPYAPLFHSIIHAIRNAVDHGIEPLLERKKAHKPECATITFEYAQYENGVATITLSDDGRGLSKSKVLAKARDALRLQPDDPRLADDKWPLLIFEHGFSTKEKEEITDISGRGIGMASIKAAVEDLGGQLSVESSEGKGFKLICAFGVHSSTQKAV